MKNRNLLYILILFLLLQRSIVINGQDLVPTDELCKKYTTLLGYFNSGDYKKVGEEVEFLEEYGSWENEIKNLVKKSKECDSLKEKAYDLLNIVGDTLNAYKTYLQLYEQNPKDSDAKKYYEEYNKRQDRCINTLVQQICNSNGTIELKDSIIGVRDSIICHIYQQLKDTIQQLNETRCINSVLTDRLDSVRNEQKTSKWEKKRLNDFRNFIKAEYDYYYMGENKYSSLAKTAYKFFDENKTDSALLALDTIRGESVGKRDNLEDVKNLEGLAYLHILKAQLLEFVFDFEESEANYKKADSISHLFECRIPLITFYYRQKRDKDANERYGEWEKLIKGEEGKLYQGQLKILKNLNKFNKKFLNPFEAKNTSIPDSAKMEAYFISGNLLLKEKSLSEAEKYLRKAKEIEEKLQMDSIYKAKLYYALGKAISEDPKKIPDKKDFYEGALRFFGKDSLKYMPERAEVCDSIGKLLLSDNYKNAKKKENENDNYYEVAEDYFRKSLKIYEKLADSVPQTYNRYECDYVANLYNKLGVAQSKNSKWAEADISFKESLIHYRRLFANSQARKEEAKVIINRAINHYAQHKKSANTKQIEEWMCRTMTILSECNIAYSDEYVKMGIGVLEEYLHKTLYEDDYEEERINFSSYGQRTDKIKPELIYD
ncbi:hypothetical protein FACS189426_11180 [Bacteroidia bacterium]|nr:hypothetical protein FACS189426_11180 [Bacteroidia bacterium]